MQEQPTPAEILATVSAFLRDVAVPQLAGHSSFTARVAANAVDLVARDLSLRPAADARERTRLSALLGRDDELARLNAALAAAIRNDELAIDRTDLLEHLWLTTLDKLSIDQPTYASYRAVMSEGEGQARSPQAVA